MKHTNRIRPASGMQVQPPQESDGAEPSLSALLRQLADDSRTLIRQEVALAKVELRENVRSLARGAVLIGIGGGLVAVGLLVLTAFLVLGLGLLLGGAYWLSSLIVGGLLALSGAVALAAGRRGLKEDTLKPEQTVATLQENRKWAESEVRQIRQDLAR